MSSFKPSSHMIFLTVENDRRRLLEHCRTERDSVLTLDLNDVTHCDSAGLAFLIEAKRLARSLKKTCHIQGMTKTIQALAEFCGVEGILVSR